MTYRLRLSRQAERYLQRLDRRTQTRMARALRELAKDPTMPGTKPLTNVPGERAMRVGGWRIVYSFDVERSELNVDFVGPRGQVYREL